MAPGSDPVYDEIVKHLMAGRDPIREMYGEEASARWEGEPEGFEEG